MRPWRFVIVRGAARVQLGEVFATCRRQRDPAANDAEIDKERAKPLRAPLVIVVAAHVVSRHPTVRTVDQVHAAAAAAQNILLACFDLGFGAMWLTGSNAHDPNVKRALGLLASDEIVGFLYVARSTPCPSRSGRRSADSVIDGQAWPAHMPGALGTWQRVVESSAAVALLTALAIASPVRGPGGQDDENLHCDLQRHPDD